MKEEVRMRANLRHLRRSKGIVIVGMFILSCILASAASLTRLTNKTLSYTFTGSALGVIGLGGAKILRIEKRETDIARQLNQFCRSKQNG